MKHISRSLAPAAVIAVSIFAATAVRADDEDRDNGANRYLMTNLVSDIPGVVPKLNTVDPVLQNSWGVAFTPAGSPFWIADNATGCATLYDGDGTRAPQPTPLLVSIPLPGNIVPPTDCKPANPKAPPPAAPTGIIWNPTTNPATGFLVPGTTLPASLIFATEDGTISAWTGGLTPPDNAVLAVDKSKIPTVASGAVYKGLAF